MNATRFCAASISGFLWLSLLLAGPADGQIPEEYTNLKLLPEEITRDSLLAVMRGFALGLGVRCEYCHVGEAGQPLSEFDFASDEKPTKRKARFMLEMVRYLNGERLPTLPEAADAPRREPPVRISCETCHRGIPVPRPLEEVLAIEVAERGVEAAIAEYRRLRERFFHGTGAYDFSERRLIDLGQALRSEGDPSEALALLRLNLEHHPESARTYVALYETHEALGERDQAIAALERAAALLPDNPAIQRRLQQLRESR